MVGTTSWTPTVDEDVDRKPARALKITLKGARKLAAMTCSLPMELNELFVAVFNADLNAALIAVLNTRPGPRFNSY